MLQSPTYKLYNDDAASTKPLLPSIKSTLCIIQWLLCCCCADSSASKVDGFGVTDSQTLQCQDRRVSIFASLFAHRVNIMM